MYTCKIAFQRSFDETQHTHEEYDPDRRNANYNASSSHHYSQNNQYAYEVSHAYHKIGVKLFNNYF